MTLPLRLNPEDRFLTAREVAALLGHTYGWFMRRRKALGKHGFPEPLDMPGQHRWDPRAIDLWRAGQARPTVVVEMPRITPEDMDAAAIRLAAGIR